ncbi:beta-glucosidase family protein [Persicobacter diffluens]|uniref:Glycosyl hydrolase n=1 Tax=Persicobacter diffluens TaxID=981 RepID=A0AAN5AMV3_9BACT|nr:glycosyl hydrolase [Persicobacter diffluens]
MKKTTLILGLFLYLSGSVLAHPGDHRIKHKIDSIISLMTVEEKVKLLHAQSKFSSAGVPRLGIPELWMSDGPHGVRGEINWDDWGYAGWTNDSITAFPALTALAATFDPNVAYEYGVAIGEEARYRKKDVLLGPGVNIYRTPMNGRNFEYMGEDPLLASVMSVPYIRGVQEQGVAACIKHYALNNQEKWRGHINVQLSDRALREIYLPAFEAAVKQGNIWSVMGSYNQYNGQWCCHNEKLLNDILKKEWQFDGAVITDWGAVHSTEEAVNNGLDIEMGTWTNGLTASESFAYDKYFLANPYLEGLKAGTYDEETLDEKVSRILLLMFRTSLNPHKPLGNINSKAHQQVARKVAQESIVLLKNQNDFFPINAGAHLKIAVIGENATKMMTIGGGSSELKAKYEISPLQGIQERFKNATVEYGLGYASGPSAYGRVIDSPLDQDSLRTAAVELAKKADVVLYIGGLNKNHHQDCEGEDRLSYGLPFNQDQLLEEILAVNANTGVILLSGNAVELPWLKKVPALMQAWYLGSEAGYAIADVLAGDVNPSGKMPFSWPKKLEDNGAHYFGELSYPGDSVNVVYKEDILVGYRWHDTKKIEPEFAFGHGLSYTSFELKDFRLISPKTLSEKEVIELSCIVKNTGNCSGAEVVQLYIGKKGSTVLREIKGLKSFEKVQLKAGEQQEIVLKVNASDLAYYNEKQQDWEVEKGKYYLYLGNASNAISFKSIITIQ